MRPSRQFVYVIALSLTLLFATYPVSAQTPTIAQPTPSAANPGDPITITGTNFGATQVAGTSTVKFGSTLATVVKSWAAAAITVIVPDVPAGPEDVMVSVGGNNSAPFPFTVTVPTIPIVVTPQVIQPANGKLPASANVAVSVKNCDNNSGTDLTQGVSGPYSLMITGSGLTPSAATASKCWITSGVTIDPNAAGPYKVFLVDKAKNPVGSADMTVLDSLAGPIPPGLAPEVDVMWGVMSQQNCADAFGRRVAASLYCIQVKIGNNSGHPLQIAGIGFSKRLDALTALGSPFVTIANSSYASTRAVLIHAQSISARNVVYSVLQGAGLIMAASSPFIGKNAQSHFLAFNTIVNGPLLAAYNLILPDPILKQLTNLDDQSFRDNIVIANNTHIESTIFVEKQALTQSLEEIAVQLSSAATSQKTTTSDSKGTPAEQANQTTLAFMQKIASDSLVTVNNSKRPSFKFWTGTQSPLLVKLALGDLVIVGDEIEYLQRVQIQSNALSSVAPAPLSASPSNVSFSSQNGVTNGAAQSITLTNNGSTPLTNITVQPPKTNDFSQSSTCASTLAAAATCTISVTYSPSTNSAAVSPRTDTIQVSFSPGSTPLPVGLTGAASDTVYFSTTALSLGAATTAKAGPPATPAKPSTATLTITNFKSTSMTGLTFPISGANSAEFSPSANTCNGAALAPSSSCTVTVTFTPAAMGARTATMTVNYQIGGAGGLPQPVSLSGAAQ